MQKSRLISNFVAIILLLALSQKIGFGIFYHNWQHTKNCSTELPASSASIKSQNCNCIDDFLTPFTEANAEINSAPVVSYPVFVSPPIEYFSNYYQCFHALRGPPAFKA
jgi:hypothetical protein